MQKINPMKIIILSIVILILLSYSIWFYILKAKAKKKSLEAKNKPNSDWSTSFLEGKRAIGDPLADNIISVVMANNREEMLNGFFQLMNGNTDALPEQMLPEVKAFFKETAELPEWADKDMLKFGQQVYVQHGLLVGMLLFYKSLPECYTGAKGAAVLLSSARLNEKSGSQDHFARRLAETGLFIYQAMMPGAMLPHGKGIRAAQKVRLIHAVIRYFIKKHGWDSEKLGEPINQEDMAGTLMSFSALVLEGLDILGVRFDDTETESYIHCWRVIGHIMGVQEDLIPKNAKDALALGHAVIDHQKAKSTAGTSLTEALIIFCNKKAPPFINKEFHIKMMRFLMGDELSLLLNLELIPMGKVKIFKKSILIYIRVREFTEKVLLFALPIALIDRLLLKLSIRYLSKNEIVTYYLPKTLNTDFADKN